MESKFSSGLKFVSWQKISSNYLKGVNAQQTVYKTNKK